MKEIKDSQIETNRQLENKFGMGMETLQQQVDALTTLVKSLNCYDSNYEVTICQAYGSYVRNMFT